MHRATDVDAYIESLQEHDEAIRRAELAAWAEPGSYVPTVDDSMARLLRIIVRSMRPRRILEIGTSIGFSTVSMARVAQEYGGTVTTIEFDERVADQAERNFARFGVDDCVTILRGDARLILPRLNEEYQMIFQDVDKTLYPQLLGECLRLLAHGGVLLADDALFPVLELDPRWRDQVEPVAKYNELVMSCQQLESALLPIGDGVMVSVKR